jgi:hypothetical protein
MEEKPNDKKTVSLSFGDSPEEAPQEHGLTSLARMLEQVTIPGSDLAKGELPLSAAIKAMTGSAAKKKAPSLAFSELPAPQSNFLGLFKARTRLLPPELIKTVRITDHLVAAILRTRGNIMKLYGHLKKDRFDVGLEIEIKPEFLKLFTPEQYEKVIKRVKRLESILLNCGHTEGLESQDQMTLADFMSTQTINGLSFGSHGTEIIYDRSGTPDSNGNFPFHRFRPVDIATIYRAVRKGEQAGANLRELALKALEAMEGQKFNIDIQKLKEDQYAWLQVIEMQPRQAFTHNEMLVYNLFPSTDIEHNGYPVSPLDTCVNCITTHISIEAYWKTYFSNGKSAKGMLVIKSDEVDQQMIDAIKMQFNASINSVSNAFRTPIFGISKEDNVEWTSTQDKLENGEFNFTYDQVARNILSSFGVSPDEIPGYGHLSKGTNSQTLSESNNEFKMTAARDSGLRPLILGWQTWFNQRLLPIIDPELSQIVEIRLSGLDSESREQEAARLQQDSALFYDYDTLMSEVDKNGPGKAFGGEVPFNERFRQVMDFYSDVSDIKAKFFGDPGSLINPLLKFKRDPFYLQYLQLLMQINPNALRAMAAPKPHNLEFLKMEIQDMLDDDGIEE